MDVLWVAAALKLSLDSKSMKSTQPLHVLQKSLAYAPWQRTGLSSFAPRLDKLLFLIVLDHQCLKPMENYVRMTHCLNSQQKHGGIQYFKG